jgi:hypothetical protein
VCIAAETALPGIIQSLLGLLFGGAEKKKQSEFSGTVSGKGTENLQTTNHILYRYTISPRHDAVTYSQSSLFVTTSVSFLFLMTGPCVALNRLLC